MNDLQQQVRDFRAEVESCFPTPSPRDSMAFVITEAAELLDAMLKSGYSDRAYLRNRPRANLEGEAGDLIFMLLTTLNELDIDIEQALARTLHKIRQRVGSAPKPI